MLSNELRAFLVDKIGDALKAERAHLESGRDRDPYAYGNRIGKIQTHAQTLTWLREFFNPPPEPPTERRS